MKRAIFFFICVFFLILGIPSLAYGFGPGVSKNHQRPQLDAKLAKIIEENQGVYLGEDTKDIYLTFDCGYENGYTSQILDVLKETDTKAVFFITGHYLSSAPSLVQRMIDEGHIIGNHTYHHRDFTASTDEEILQDLRQLEVAFEEKFAKKMSAFVRPPRGEFSEKSQKLLASEGYRSVFWSLAYVDWNKDTFYGNHYSYQKVIQRIHNGAVILMHTVSKDNATDLKDIITELKSQGYQMKTMDDLFRTRLL